HPDGYYASLAKLQLNQIEAEDARVAATEKARQAQQQQARLASEGAQRAEQEKAAADLKAAEGARIAAERTKKAAQQQAAEAERKRTASEASIVAALTRNKATVDSPAMVNPPPAAVAAQSDTDTKVAALNAGPQQADPARVDIPQADLA